MKLRLGIGFFLFLVLFCSVAFGADEKENASGEKTTTSVRDILNQALGPGQQSTIKRSERSKSPLRTVEQFQSAHNLGGLTSARSLSAVNPDRYEIQAGDALSVELWTPAHNAISGVVSPMGTLNIPPVGEIPVKGIKLRQLSATLKTELEKYYKRVRVNANLTDVRIVKVQVLGEVRQPGTYEVAGTAGALDALERALGLTEKASLRQIELRKGNQLVRKLDYFKWRIFGSEEENTPLEPNTVVYVPVIRNQVEINGEVQRPGLYEVLPGETLEDLLKMSGGYTSEAVPAESKVSRITALHTQVNMAPEKTLQLQDGDSVYVPPMSLFQKKIKVMGEVIGARVFKPTQNNVTGTPELTRIGWYQLHEKERVRDVILNMGGLTPKADPARARVERKNEKGETVVIPVNLNKLFAENNTAQNVELKDGDTLVIPPAPDSVYVLGEVTKPGVYTYNPGNQIREYVALAGGVTSYANMKHTKLVRVPEGGVSPQVFDVDLKNLLLGISAQRNLLLEPGDVIYIPRTEIRGLGDIIGLLSNISIVRALFVR